jgi:hypothetical protein
MGEVADEVGVFTLAEAASDRNASRTGVYAAACR